MQKTKTHKSVAKRIRRSGKGLLLLRKMSITHRSRFKSRGAKQRAKHKTALITKVARKLRRVI